MRRSEADHVWLVKFTVDQLQSAGYDPVCADHISGMESPDKMGGFVPDVVGYRFGEIRVIAEVETDDSIRDEHTASQWKAFSAAAKAKDATFVVVVPSGSEKSARVQLRQLGISETVVW